MAEPSSIIGIVTACLGLLAAVINQVVSLLKNSKKSLDKQAK
jgi:hypothetical protein